MAEKNGMGYEKKLVDEQNMEKMLNNIRAAAYTIRIKDYRLSFLNRELKNMLPDAQAGEKCYKVLWDLDAPCEFCPIRDRAGDNFSAHMELFNQKLSRYLSFDVVDITDARGELVALFTAYDISRLVESENRLRELAFTDALTNVRNRNAFMQSLSSLYEQKCSGCIGLLNIKFLKQYNLLYGKKAGDLLLIRIAYMFDQCYPRNRVFRVDGAKLAFLAEGEKESEEMHRVVKQTVEKLLKEWENSNFKLCFDTAFIPFPSCAGTPEELIFNGEYLLRKCGKINSSGSVLELDKNELAMLKRRNCIKEILRRGDYAGKFQVYYQPIYNINSNSFSKCEALLRLIDEELGVVSPLEFIPLAEEDGHIGKLDSFVLKEVCRFLSNRRQKQLQMVQVNINISSVEFAGTGFLEGIITTTDHYHISPNLIQFEITEGIFINSVDYVVKIMNTLIDKGFSFAIDDFGTGYSNLSYIGTMPLKCLKLDKSFVDQMLQSESYKLIISYVIELAKGLHLTVVAEGIESSEQFEMIKKMGANYIQGYLFSKALQREQFEKFLEEAVY